jgi:hypothetical protein
MQQVLSGLLLGLVLMGGSLAVFRRRHAIIESNYQMRRGGLGQFISTGMMGGDRMMFPVLSVVLFLAGLALVGWSVYSFVVGRY